MGLPKANRLRSRLDFKAVYQYGITRKSRHLTLRVLLGSREGQKPNPVPSLEQEETIPTQIGISIGKKTSKKAVVRNRLKRQIRSAFRELLPDMEPGWKIVVGVRPGVTECKYEDFLRQLKELLIKSNLINGYQGKHFL